MLYKSAKENFFEKAVKEYKNVFCNNFNKSYPQREKEKTMNCVARTAIKDLLVQRVLMIKQFKNMKSS